MDNFKKIYNDLKKNPRGKALAFFGLYFIFFLILILMIRGANGINKPNKVTDDPVTDANVGLLSKNGSNYAYNYTINIDGEVDSYNGSRNGNKELFTYNDEVNYFKENDLYYTNESGNWVSSNRPSKYDAIFQNIGKIIDEANYIAKTEYQSGKIVMKYEVDTKSIYKVVNSLDSSFSSVNDLAVTIENDKITNITLDLNDYCTNTKECRSNMTIVMKYDEFDKQEEIINNVER